MKITYFLQDFNSFFTIYDYNKRVSVRIYIFRARKDENFVKKGKNRKKKRLSS